MSLTSFVHHWRELFRFRALDADARSIVFYAEDAGSWRYLEPIISELTEGHGRQICYLTSSPRDPVLKGENNRIKTFCIGFGTPRTMLFQYLQANVMVMTMPDLETYHIKRSKQQVHYVYVHHSMVSTHMIYRKGAFDHFDSILCVGPHHDEEVRATEGLYGLSPKNLVPTGYGLLDSILSTQGAINGGAPEVDNQSKRVLVAPSWGENGLLESHGSELVEVLLNAGHRVTVRPHSMTIRERPKLLGELQSRFGQHPGFHLQSDLTLQGTVQNADIMISDWSGAALEYAFGLERPVIFVDVPRKVNNAEYERISCVPVEVKLRSEIGEVVAPDRLTDIPALVDKLCRNPHLWRQQIRELRSSWVYNIGTSGKVAADYIAKVAGSAQVVN